MYWVVNKALPLMMATATATATEMLTSARAALDNHAALMTTVRTSQTNRKQVVCGFPSPPDQLLFLQACKDVTWHRELPGRR